MSAELRILVYSPVAEGEIATALGRPDYSYYFVYKRFLPLLAKFGTVQPVADLTQLDALVAQARSDGDEPILMLFAPPHETPEHPPCPVVPVFAWEFDTIPDEPLGGSERHNWVAVLSESPVAITHSQFAVDSVRRSLGADYPIYSMPAPVFDGFSAIPDAGWTGQPRQLQLNGTVLDSVAMGLRDEPEFSVPELDTGLHTLELSGVVFTSIFNPADKRKNWLDALSAFVWAFRDNPDATLVLKLVHFDRELACWTVLQEMRKLAPYQCRVVALHGYLEQDSFDELVRATTYTVNSAHAEGQCLPLMEFMSAGKPAIAPDHTSMADYINPENAFVVAGHREPAAWPQDPRMVFRCTRYRIEWATLRDGYEQAWQLVTENPAAYWEMSRQAQETLRAHCSQQVIEGRLAEALEHLAEVTVLPNVRASHAPADTHGGTAEGAASALRPPRGDTSGTAN